MKEKKNLFKIKRNIFSFRKTELKKEIKEKSFKNF